MWKEPATCCESKKNLSTGGVVKCGSFSTWKIMEKNIPQALFHLSPKSGGKVQYVLQSAGGKNGHIMSSSEEQNGH